jgi:RimJ/RimL family protein N-acetyltransferase
LIDPAPNRSPVAPATGFVVRELRWSDFDDLRDAYYLLYEERESRVDIGITLFRTRPSYEDEVAWFAGLYRQVLSGESIVAIAERADHAIGNCTVRRVGPSKESEMAHVGELGILVHRDHRGAGVGGALLERALFQCRGKFDVVRLSVFSVNVRARRLYERFGFIFVGKVPRVVRRGAESFDEDLMVLELGQSDANR